MAPRPQLLPGEPEDTTDHLEARRWISAYTQLVQGLTISGRDTPNPELLGRLVAATARYKWWQRRWQQLQDQGSSQERRNA